MTPEVRRDMVKFGIILLLFCAVGGGSLSFTYAATLPKIRAQAQAEEERASRTAMPQATEFKRRDDLTAAAVAKFPEFMGKGSGKVFDALKDGVVIGSIIQLSVKGYGGPVQMAVAVQNGVVLGFTVADHKETAGMGSKIKDDPSWGKQFAGKSLVDPIDVKKDIVAITGATKSSKAAALGVRTALEIYNAVYGGAAK